MGYICVNGDDLILAFGPWGSSQNLRLMGTVDPLLDLSSLLPIHHTVSHGF